MTPNINPEALERAVDAVCTQWNMHRPDVQRMLECALPELLAAQPDELHQHLLDMLGAKDHVDSGRIIGELHAETVKQPLQVAAQPLDYTPGELDRTAPARIWLQIDTAGDNADRSDAWAGSEGVTWQDESLGGLEIEYVRADLAAQPASSAGGQESVATVGYKDGYLRGILTESGRKLPVGTQLFAAPVATEAAAQAVNLGPVLRNLMTAAYYMRNRVVETRGVKCMDDLDAALKAAERALLNSQQKESSDGI